MTTETKPAPLTREELPPRFGMSTGDMLISRARVLATIDALDEARNEADHLRANFAARLAASEERVKALERERDEAREQRNQAQMTWDDEHDAKLRAERERNDVIKHYNEECARSDNLRRGLALARELGCSVVERADMRGSWAGTNDRAVAAEERAQAAEAQVSALRDALEDVDFESDWRDNLELVDRVRAALSNTAACAEAHDRAEHRKAVDAERALFVAMLLGEDVVRPTATHEEVKAAVAAVAERARQRLMDDVLRHLGLARVECLAEQGIQERDALLTLATTPPATEVKP